MTQWVKKATLAALVGTIVAVCVVGGCTYRTLEIQFRDVASKEPVQGINVQAGEPHILMLFPTQADGKTNQSGGVKLALREKARVRVVAWKVGAPNPNRPYCFGSANSQTVLIESTPEFSEWNKQPFMHEHVESRWRILD